MVSHCSSRTFFGSTLVHWYIGRLVLCVRLDVLNDSGGGHLSTSVPTELTLDLP